MKELTIAILGAGEMATGIAHRLFSAGFRRIVMSDIEWPVAVRRNVAFCEAVYDGRKDVEGVTAELIHSLAGAENVWNRRSVAIVVDRTGAFVGPLNPDVLIDATMEKKEKPSMKRSGLYAIGIGPGFSAPTSADAVIESNRGHHLGRVIYGGRAEPYAPKAGTTMGYANERILRSPHPGIVRPVKSLNDRVAKDEVILYVDETPVKAEIDGLLRGLIRPIRVPKGEKLGDIDPRGDENYCHTISDKARAIAGGVLETIMHRFNGPVNG